MANERYGGLKNPWAFPNLDLGSCSKQQVVLLWDMGSLLRGLQGPPVLKDSIAALSEWMPGKPTSHYHCSRGTAQV